MVIMGREKKEFKNKVVLVTGASRGIGRATARAFAQQGANLAVHYHENKEAAGKTIESLPRGPHRLFCCDISDPGAAQSLIEEVVGKFGRLDVLVNNAGVFRSHAIQEISYQQWLEAWQQTLATNLRGPANLMFWAARQMAGQGGGRIVNVSSRGAFRGEPDAPAYGASKAGLNALSQSLAQALAPKNIFVTVVAPGFVETDMVAESLASPQGESIRKQSPMGRVARPEEVARVILFLASEGGDYLTGAIVDVNGASYLRS
jgi:NAD(P)-dependent dehydrogenase (short-subunit alcohol dehydrogenase family)